MPLEALCVALGECVSYTCCSPLSIFYVCIETCVVGCQSCAIDWRHARDSSGCHCHSNRGGVVRLNEDDEQTEEGRHHDSQNITTTQPKWSAVAALRNS